MANYQYLVVPFQGQIKAGGSAAAVSAQLESVINRYASEGWEFYTLNDVNIEVTPGCISGLFGAKAGYVLYDQVIFRRPAKTSLTVPPSESARCSKCGGTLSAVDVRFCTACGNPLNTDNE